MTYQITKDGETQTFEDREAWEDVQALLDENGVAYDASSSESSESDPERATDGGESESAQNGTQAAQATADLDALGQLGDELETDPLSILPGHMIDHIQGTPAVNKRGYCMIAERYGIAVEASIEQYPWENDEGRCVARATATTEDSRTYSGWATACADDGDMADQIIELAETRALKRSVSWASGVGIVSYQEMVHELEETQ